MIYWLIAVRFMVKKTPSTYLSFSFPNIIDKNKSTGLRISFFTFFLLSREYSSFCLLLTLLTRVEVIIGYSRSILSPSHIGWVPSIMGLTLMWEGGSILTDYLKNFPQAVSFQDFSKGPILDTVGLFLFKNKWYFQFISPLII